MHDTPEKVKLFTDLELIRFGFPVEILIPFIGLFNGEDNPGKMMSSRFNEFAARGKELIELTDLDEADACLLPIYYIFGDEEPAFLENIKCFLDKVVKSRKKIIVFTGHDRPVYDIRIDNAIIFNSAINKSVQPSNVFAYPHFFEDYIRIYRNNELSVRQKGATPVIGFCGFAPPVGLRFGRSKVIGMLKLAANYLGIMKKYPARASHSYRARAIIGLRRSKKISTNFRIKSTIAFGPQGQLNTGNTVESDDVFRRNFVNNIVDSDYTLCVRGIGNNSIRFFESLCCGRIPVFVNTDCVLPFDNQINWKSMCIWVEAHDIDKIDKIVLNFHQSRSNDQLIELQKKIRSVWEEYLTPVGFYKHIKFFLDLPEKV